MTTLFFRNPRLTALAILVMVAAGLSAFISIGRQEDPTINNIFATITTSYPGADPARVEALVTEKIETELKEVPEVSIIESTSATGVSIVLVELLETLPDERVEQVWSEIRDAVSDASRSFPSGVLTPQFDNDNFSAFAAISALRPVSAHVPQGILQRYAKILADTIRDVPGTKLVSIFGEVSEEILVSVDMARASALGLTVDTISASIRTADSKVQAGRVRGEKADFLIEVEGEISALDRIRRIPLATSPSGSLTRLGDVASVEKTIRQPVTELAYSNGTPAILIAARVNDGLQIDTWASDLKAVLAGFEADLPVSIVHEQIFDQSIYTRSRLLDVSTSLAIGVTIVIAVLFLTLGARAALIVAVILPLVSLASLATMNLIGMPIHQMSITGLIVALGLLVDAAIVMTDEIRRRLVDGMAAVEAVTKAVRRLFAPLLASTITTVLAFLPMALLPGPAGDFVGSIAIAVIIMLVWSFIIAMTLTPAFAGWFLTPSDPDQGKGLLSASGRAFGSFLRATLSWSIRNPASSIAYALVLPIIGFMSFSTLTAQFFPGVDRDQFHIEVEMTPGTAIRETALIARAIDEHLRDKQTIRSVSWVIGKSAPAFYYNMAGTREQEQEFAHALISTVSAQATAALVPELQAELSASFPAARILVRDLVQGPPVDAPIEFRLVGNDLTTLRNLGSELQAAIAGNDDITTVRSTLDGGAPKLSLSVDENEARLAGLDLNGIARQLEAALEGATGGSLLEGTEELPVRVRLDTDFRQNMSAVQNLPVLPVHARELVARGIYPGIPLASIASAELVPAESVIMRRNSERTNTVQAFVQYGVLPELALANARKTIAASGFTLPDGYRLETGGDSDARNDTMNNLIAPLGLIVTLTIATVVMVFNSFRLSAITFAVAVLSAGLSLLCLAVFQYPFGIVAVIGVIGSIGVSINAALVILSALQADKAAAANDENAIVDVVMGSSRHIISTTVTTFGGFLPLILAGGGFWPPFAMAVGGGVLLSTLISFYFVPPMFRLIYAGRARTARRAMSIIKGQERTQEMTSLVPFSKGADSMPEKPLPIAAE